MAKIRFTIDKRYESWYYHKNTVDGPIVAQPFVIDGDEVDEVHVVNVEDYIARGLAVRVPDAPVIKEAVVAEAAPILDAPPKKKI